MLTRPAIAEAPGEPQDQHAADVVDGPERLADPLVGQVGQRPPAGRAALLELRRGDQQGGHQAGGDQVAAHDERGGGQQPAGVADPGGQPFLRRPAVRPDQRHHADPGLEARETQHQQREGGQRGQHQATDAAPGGEPVGQAAEHGGVGEHVADTHDHHDQVQRQEHRDQRDGDGDGLGEAEQEHPAEDQQQGHGQRDGVTLQGVREERVLQHVHAGVGRRQRDRDDRRGRHEAEQDEDEELAPPGRQQALQHRHRALPVRALRGHPAVHGQHAEEGERHDEQRGQRRERARGQRRDPRQVGERGGVVDTGQAHDLPPRVAGVAVPR
jgi:hypothetical protein